MAFGCTSLAHLNAMRKIHSTREDLAVFHLVRIETGFIQAREPNDCSLGARHWNRVASFAVFLDPTTQTYLGCT